MLNHSPHKLICGAACALMVLGFAPSAIAQEQDPNAQQAPAQTNFSQNELESFAKASLEVEQINRKWVDQIAKAESAEEGQSMRNQAVQEMSQAIRGEGLDVQTYNSIYDTAENNPEIAGQIKDFRQQHR
ncbi:MAG: DUF4168 domain-containing protein [Rhodovibrionaceae bacterium]